MSDFLNALAATREAFRHEEYIYRVKELIRDQILQLDKEALVEDTHYFNHSAIPDFVIKWAGQKASRDFYLRASYASIVAANDVGSNSSGDPVFLSLDANKDFSTEFPPISPKMIKDEPKKSTYTLLTDVRAMSEISVPAPSSYASPLTDLVRSSFVRGGRGLIDDERAEALVSTEKGDDKPDLLEVVRESFSESAATKMERTAAIVGLALESADTADEKQIGDLDQLSGRLSETELKAILPWLLKQEKITQDLAFWRRIGEMTTFRDIEAIAYDLDGLDLRLLLTANAHLWKAKRTYLGISARIANESDENSSESVAAPLGWSFRSGNLGLDNGRHRVLFSSDGRSLPGRDESRIPDWEELKENLTDFQLSSVNLRGITRSVRIDAEQSDDIRQDVEDVAQSLDDRYSVSEVALRFAPRETKSGAASVAIRFGKGLTTTEGGATLADLARASLQVLAYKDPVSAEEVDQMFDPESVTSVEDLSIPEARAQAAGTAPPVEDF